jgi:hypothetical protein
VIGVFFSCVDRKVYLEHLADFFAIAAEKERKQARKIAMMMATLS